MVNSLIRSIPKKAREKAAASNRLSCPDSDLESLMAVSSLLRIGPVIGSLVLRAVLA